MPPLKFIYPRTGGIQAFADGQFARVFRGSGKTPVIMGASVEKLETEANKVREIVLSNGDRLPAELLVGPPRSASFGNW